MKHRFALLHAAAKRLANIGTFWDEIDVMAPDAA